MLHFFNFLHNSFVKVLFKTFLIIILPLSLYILFTASNSKAAVFDNLPTTFFNDTAIPTTLPQNCSNHSLAKSIQLAFNVPFIVQSSKSDLTHYYYFTMPETGTVTLTLKSEPDCGFSFQIITPDNTVLRQWTMASGSYTLQGLSKNRYYLAISMENISSEEESVSYQLSCQISYSALSKKNTDTSSQKNSISIPVIDTPAKKKPSLQSIKLSRKKLTLKKGKTYRLKTTLKPGNAASQNLKWHSSRKKTVSVTQKGKIKAKKAGTAKIKVFSTANKKIFAVCKVKVLAPSRKKAVKPKAISSPKPSSDSTQKFSSGSSAETASKSETASKANKKKASSTVKLQHLTLSTSVLRLSPGKKFTLLVTCSPANTTQTKLTWKSVSPSIASVSSGKITAHKKGITTIIVSSKDNPAICISCTVIVR